MAFLKEKIRAIGTIAKAERGKLARYGTIGVLSLVLTTVLYHIVSARIFPHASRTLLYTLVVIFVSWLNYEANSYFTFEKKRSVATITRFATVAVIATILNTVLFWIGYEIFHLWDLLVIVLNCGIVTLFTFSSHRLFTFHENPWRHLARLKSAFFKES